MITEFIHKLVERIDLTQAEAGEAMRELMTGNATDAQIAAFLTALRMKGETATELVGFAQVMRDKAEPFWDGATASVMDIVGTGGDGSGTFNISTAAGLVASGAGLKVAKHGNRAASSKCGSADVLEALGVNLQMPMDRLRLAVTDIGFGFLFAQRFHSSMKHVMPTRSQLKMRTVFNILGPLANPARAEYQVVGVFTPALLELMARALHGLGVRHAFVVHGSDGVDEISISGPSRVVEMRNGELRSYTITPGDFGVTPAARDAVRGGDAVANAAIIEAIFKGERGPRRDVVLMNAAAAIVAAGGAASLNEAFKAAAGSIDSGAAMKKLDDVRELSR
jgi:anthranilate phosphoribosyltransferase